MSKIDWTKVQVKAPVYKNPALTARVAIDIDFSQCILYPLSCFFFRIGKICKIII